MRKRMIVLTGLVISVAGIYLATSSLAKPIAPSMRIGVMVSDSGSLYFAGAIQRAAAKLASSDLAETVKVNLVFEDAGDSVFEARNALARVKAFDADLLLAPIESDSARLVAQFTKDQFPIIATAPLADDVDNKQPFLRLTSSHSQDIISLAEMISRDRPATVLIVYSSDQYGKDVMKSLAFGLTLRGVPKVQVIGINELSAIRKIRPEVLIVASMEQSVGFFSSMRDWLPQVEQIYLVPGNLANYTAYPWAKTLKGTKAILPKDPTTAEFRSRLASALGRPSLLSNPKAPIFALAWHTYEAVLLAGQAFLEAKSTNPDSLRTALLNSKSKGELRFQSSGYLRDVDYTVFGYGVLGSYAPEGSFSPN
jgi:ABC-type branched-subunit amino acid transport system substrate-binding protein